MNDRGKKNNANGENLPESTSKKIAGGILKVLLIFLLILGIPAGLFLAAVLAVSYPHLFDLLLRVLLVLFLMILFAKRKKIIAGYQAIRQDLLGDEPLTIAKLITAAQNFLVLAYPLLLVVGVVWAMEFPIWIWIPFGLFFGLLGFGLVLGVGGRAIGVDASFGAKFLAVLDVSYFLNRKALARILTFLVFGTVCWIATIMPPWVGILGFVLFGLWFSIILTKTFGAPAIGSNQPVIHKFAAGLHSWGEPLIPLFVVILLAVGRNCATENAAEKRRKRMWKNVPPVLGFVAPPMPSMNRSFWEPGKKPIRPAAIARDERIEL